MVRIGAIVWQVSDLGRANEFWRGALADFVVLADPDGNLFCVIDRSA